MWRDTGADGSATRRHRRHAVYKPMLEQPYSLSLRESDGGPPNHGRQSLPPLAEAFLAVKAAYSGGDSVTTVAGMKTLSALPPDMTLALWRWASRSAH